MLETLEDRQSEVSIEDNGTFCIQVTPLLPTKTGSV